MNMLEEYFQNSYLVNTYGIYPLTIYDRDIVGTVYSNSNIFSYNPISKYPSSTFELESKKAIDSLYRQYGEHVTDDAIKILKSINKEEKETMKITPIYDYDKDKFVSLEIPEKIYTNTYIELVSSLLHMLKERELNEVKNKFRYSDVIPYFNEILISEESSSPLKEDIIRKRINDLNGIKMLYFKDIKKTFSNTKNGYDYFKLSYDERYISFYFSVLMYLKYLSNPKEVINEIKNVLINKTTTKQSLYNLSIYGYINAGEYVKGLELIKK